jgi:5-methyltetrahydrofolate--homocysteine methyltransferase
MGLDAAIVDPTDSQLMANLIAGETVAGRDEYCMNFITAFRAGKLE